MNVCVFFLKRHIGQTYTNYIFSIIFLLPNAAFPTLHYHTQNKYPKEIKFLCQVPCKYKRYSWKHYLECFLKETSLNIFLVIRSCIDSPEGAQDLFNLKGKWHGRVFEKHSKWKTLSPWESSLVSQYLSHWVSIFKKIFDYVSDPCLHSKYYWSWI